LQLLIDNGTARYRIRGYTANSVTVNDIELVRSFIITPDRLIADWAPRTIADITTEQMRLVLELMPDLVLLGTGQSTQFPCATVRAAVLGLGIGLEAMDTASACRAYGVLTSEGRNIAAAILMPDAAA
jgi:uncharacterized protein